jgi:hypothetical protein
MPRTHKANKRAASRRHASKTPRRSSLRATAQPSSPTSAIPTKTRTDAPTNATLAPIPPITMPAANSLTRQDHQSHQDHRAHPDQAALKERAFALSCIGLRSPAIAAQLGVSERTIRHWNYTTLRTLALDATGLSPDLDAPTNADVSGTTASTGPEAPTGTASETAAPAPDTYRMEYHRALAIERQLDIAVTARAGYDRLMAQHDHLLAQYIAACDANLAATATVAATALATAGTAATAAGAADEASPTPPLPAAVASMARLLPRLASSAARQLQIAQAAHREVARLQGVTSYAQTDARLAAEYEAKQAQQAADPDEEQGGLVPIHFFDAKAAIDDICGPDDDDEDGDTATCAPTQNAAPDSAAKTANDPGNSSGNSSGNNSGNNSGNGTSHNTLGAHSMPGPNAVW